MTLRKILTPAVILFCAGGLVAGSQTNESEQCRKFREWQEAQSGNWSETGIVVTGCRDLSEDDWFDRASRFGKHSDAEICEDAGTYRRWFQDAWDNDGWRIEFGSPTWSNGAPESGFHPQDNASKHHGIGVRNDYSTGSRGP